MAQVRSVGRMAWFAAIVLASLIGCGAGADQTHLDLSWEDFDQNRASGWRPLAARGDYAAAARLIETYLDRRDDLQPAQRGYSLFHAGQLWALHGDTDRALALIDRATVPDMPPEFPRSFNALVAGTRAFLRGDMGAVGDARDEVVALPARTPRDDEFLAALELLARSEGLTYLEVYAAATE